MKSLILHPFEVRAILDGRLGLIVRPIKSAWQLLPFESEYYLDDAIAKCPLGKVGDSVIGKEVWGCSHSEYIHGLSCWHYADGEPPFKTGPAWKKRSAATMPAWASRITLTLEAIRVQRVGEMVHKEALATGIPYHVSEPDGAPLPRFQEHWNTLCAKRGLGVDANPWCWFYTVKGVVR